MTFAQRRNRLTTHFSEGIPVVKRRMRYVGIERFIVHNFLYSVQPLGLYIIVIR